MSAAAETLRTRCTEAEWAARVDLAALYRLSVKYGWTDLIYTHHSARMPGEPEQYLMKPDGEMFDEVTASSILRVGFDGTVHDERGQETNDAGHLIHSAVLGARPDVQFVMHTHSRAGTAVSAMKCGLLALSQHANIVRGCIAYHPYAVVGDDADECERLGRDLGDKNLMVLNNHGLLACGRTAAEAFWYLYYLEMACKIQVDVMTAGAEMLLPEDEAVKRLVEYGRPGDEPHGDREWPALMRMLDRADPSFRE